MKAEQVESSCELERWPVLDPRAFPKDSQVKWIANDKDEVVFLLRPSEETVEKIRVHRGTNLVLVSRREIEPPCCAYWWYWTQHANKNDCTVFLGPLPPSRFVVGDEMRFVPRDQGYDMQIWNEKTKQEDKLDIPAGTQLVLRVRQGTDRQAWTYWQHELIAKNTTDISKERKEYIITLFVNLFKTDRSNVEIMASQSTIDPTRCYLRVANSRVGDAVLSDPSSDVHLAAGSIIEKLKLRLHEKRTDAYNRMQYIDALLGNEVK